MDCCIHGPCQSVCLHALSAEIATPHAVMLLPYALLHVHVRLYVLNIIMYVLVLCTCLQYLDGPEVDCDLIFDGGRAVYGAVTDNWWV